jgi:hypothetical protein
MIGRTAERYLDCRQLFPQIHRIAFAVELNDCIQKFLRAWLTIDRIGFVNRRGKNRGLDACEIENLFSRRAQIIEAIAKIRPKCNGDSHCDLLSRQACRLQALREAQPERLPLQTQHILH